MRRILLLCWLVAGSFLTVSCGGTSQENTDTTTIEDTIRGYVTTFNTEDFDKCLTYLTDYEDKEDTLAFL